MKDALIDAARPVQDTAESLAVSRIRNMPGSPEWAKMRIGVSRREALVYMVPASRGRRRGKRWRRPTTSERSFAPLLASRAMDPALDQNQEQVVHNIDNLLDSISRKAGF